MSDPRDRELADASAWPTCLLTTSLHCLYANAAWRTFVGGGDERHVGPAWKNNIHPAHMPRVEALCRATKPGAEGGRAEVLRRDHAGRWRWMLEAMTSILSHSGQVVLIWNAIDITSLKKAQLRRRAKVRQQRAVAAIGRLAVAAEDLGSLYTTASHIVASVLRLPAAGVFVSQAHGSRQMFTQSRDLIASIPSDMPVDCLINGDDQSHHVCVISDWSKIQERQIPGNTLRGRYAASAAVRIGAADDPLGVLAVFADKPRTFQPGELRFLHIIGNILTAANARQRIDDELRHHRDRLEELVLARTKALEQSHDKLRSAERLAAVGTLAAGLGHDIGNLVLPTLCRLETLAAQPLPSNVKEELIAIRQTVVRLRHLSTGLQLFAQDPEDPGASTAVTHLSQWWEDVAMLIRKAVPRHVIVSSSFAPDLPAVAVPAHQLTQALYNIVANAGEAVDEKGRVQIGCEPAIQTNMVRLFVRDNGRGMDSHVRRHAIDPYFTTKRRSLTTGLGLSMVHGILESVGGKLHIESEPGEGSVVSLLLPVAVGIGPIRMAAGKTARIDIRDTRIASYATGLLQMSGFKCHLNGNAVAEEETLWVLDPHADRFPGVLEFLNSRPDRRVIVIGAAPEHVKHSGLIAIDGTLRELRRALLRTVTIFAGGMP